MAGETDLNNMLAGISPVLLKETYVFCTLPDACYGDFASAKPIASFEEKEGLSLVVTKQAAEQHELRFEGSYRCISLGVHSSLDAVGLTATISRHLTLNGISANIIAAHFHDHVFVAASQADLALSVITSLAASQQQNTQSFDSNV